MKKNKRIKIFVLLFLCLLLCGCTKVLQDKDGKAVVNEETGQSVTANILCKPVDEKTIELYENNDIDLSKLPKCDEMKITGKYESIWTSLFVRPLAWIIINIGHYVGTTALAIIIVTLIIRIILYPVTKKTAMQSENIKEAQPELNRIEAKYKDKTDPESMNKKGQEMLLVYKKYNISPLSGCLFSLIQLPLLFAFLEAINRVPAIFEETFLGLQMGTTPWAAFGKGQWYYIVLIILILLTTFFSFKMNQSTASPEMQKQNQMMMWFMVIFIGFMSFRLPAAIAIYWIISSGFTILQNVITDILKKNEKGNKSKVKVKVKNGKASI